MVKVVMLRLRDAEYQLSARAAKAVLEEEQNFGGQQEKLRQHVYQQTRLSPSYRGVD